MRPPAFISAKIVIGGIAAVSLFALGFGVALNREGTTTLTAAGTAATPTPSPNTGHKGAYGGHVGAGLGASLGPVMSALSKETGKSRTEIMTEVRNSQTLDQIAGSKASQVKADAVATVKTGLQSAVSKGVLTQTQADHLLADASDAIDQLMAAKLGAGLSSLGKGGFGFGLPFGDGKRGHLTTPSPSPTPAV